jgi:hypothetical protein
MDTLLLLAIATLAVAILANLASSFGVDSREELGQLDRPVLS